MNPDSSENMNLSPILSHNFDFIMSLALYFLSNHKEGVQINAHCGSMSERVTRPCPAAQLQLLSEISSNNINH